MCGARSIGVAFVLLGGLAMGLALQIEVLGLGQNQDPGPRAFPMALGGILVIGGLYELALSFRKGRHSPEAPDQEEAHSHEAKDGRWQMLVVFIGLCVYVGCIGVIGFGLSTLVFAIGMMRLLGVRWPASIGTAIGLLVIIHVLFVGMFKVQLPVGTLGLPF